jgi:ferredoxin-NADP reductase
MTAVAPVPVLGRLRERAARLAGMVATPLVPSDYLDLLDPLRSGSALRGRLVEVRPETADAATLVIRPGRGWRGHVPGQYLRIGVDVDGVRLWRSYSLTSPADRPDGCLCVTVKVQPGGKVSEHLVRRARPGLVVQLDQAAGEFVLSAESSGGVPDKALFVTAGSGITPVMGMLRSAGPALRDVVVVHSAPTADDVIFGDELRRLAATGRVRLVERHTRIDGHVKPDQLADLVPDLAERQTWACGPAAMLDALEEHWAVLGLRDQLHTERFSAPALVTGEGGEVTFGRSAVTVQAPGGTALLDAGEAAGVLMPSGCRMGICFGCVVPLRTGAVRDLRDGALTTAVEGDGVLVQTCINAAAGACELDL